MIETSVLAWAVFALLLLAATGAGVALSAAMPWDERARNCGLPVAAGAVLAPFLAGLLAVLALGLLPGLAAGWHASLVVVVLAAILVWKRRQVLDLVGWRAARTGDDGGWLRRLLALALAAWVVGLLVDSVFMPLTQNDALEYATVGRLLYETRDLASYPALDPSSASGFFGPWTHPPLYVALIYLAHALQGHAAEPGLARLVAPWFLLSTLALVAAVARLHSRAAAVGAGLVFMGAPLLYLGAGSALIDALPVAGFALVLAAVIGFRIVGAAAGAWQGLLLGASLWTHSQALLFVPLTAVALLAHHGIRIDRRVLAHAAGLLGVALLVAAWPYARNLALFGSAVSDNPAVFAMPQLEWPAYFQMARGYESWSEKLQYGLFKGWSMLEAYAGAFWLSLPGQWLFLRRPGPSTVWLRAVFGVFACYLAGVLLSILLGIDLMIRNERYQLVLLPCVAWFGGLFIAAAVHAVADARAATLTRAAGAGFCLLLLGSSVQQLLVVGGHKARTYGVQLSILAAPLADKLRDFPTYEAVRFLAVHSPRDALVLSLKPADMYYAGRRMVSYLDPRLIPIYAETDPVRMRDALLRLRIRYVHVPDYALPPMYRTALEAIMARPDLSDLVHSVGGHQIYDLREPEPARVEAARDLSPGARTWSSRQAAVLGGRVGLVRVAVQDGELGAGEWSRPAHDWPLFRRELTTLLATGGSTGPAIAVEGGREYRLDLQLEGHAFAAVYLVQYDAEGRALDLPRGGRTEVAVAPGAWSFLSKQRIGEAAIVGGQPPRGFSRRFLVYPQARSIGVIVEHRGATTLRVGRATLHAVRADLLGAVEQ